MLQFLVGSTGCKLLRVHTGTLLIVRSADVTPYQRVLAALDFSPDARAALDEFLYGSVSAAVAQGADCDVLVVNQNTGTSE